MEEKKKLSKMNKFHILLIIVGILFSGASIFHTSIWFDECYSVGMARHNFIDIWNIGGHDVHPVLYYWVLSIINVMTGGNLIAYRVFSTICIALVGILGFTHIRKDFGDKTGILFSFFSFFLPSVCIFTGDIRMYAMAILLVTICAIYGYRIYKGETTWKNWIIFELTSLACIYTHYYGLMAAGLINLVMLANFIRNRRTQSTRRIIIFGVILAALYVPWMLYFVSQLQHVSKGFWIGFEFPDTLQELLSFQFIGAMGIGTAKNYWIGFIVSIIIYIYLAVKAVKLKKSGEDMRPAKLAGFLYLGVILAALLMTVVLHTSILYFRYLFVITGLYIFAMSFILSKEKNKYIVAAICTVTLGLGIVSNVLTIKDNYDSSNMKQIEFLNENVQEGDVFVYTDIGAGSVIADYYPNNKQYFFNEPDWGVEEAYKAFAPQMDTYVKPDFIDELNGRIWIVDGWNCDEFYNRFFNNEKYRYVSRTEFHTAYQGYNYIFVLVEKVAE